MNRNDMIESAKKIMSQKGSCTTVSCNKCFVVRLNCCETKVVEQLAKTFLFKIFLDEILKKGD